MVLAASAAAACFPRAEIGPMGNNDAQQEPSAGFHRFPPQPHAPGKKEKPPPRAKNALSAPDGREKQLPRAEKALSAPGSGEKQLPRAEKSLSAPDGRKKLLPRAEKALNAPDSREKRLPRAEKALSAPGSRKKQLPRAEKAISAPGSKEKQLPRAEKALNAPGSREKQFERSEAPSGACREGGAMRRPEGTRREGFRRPQADRRGTAKPCGGILSPVPWGCRGNQWGPREARIPHEPRNASENAGVDAVSEGFEPPVRCRTPVFEAGSFNHSDNSPSNRTTKVGKNLILP